jgi:hypothetical protein
VDGAGSLCFAFYARARRSRAAPARRILAARLAGPAVVLFDEFAGGCGTLRYGVSFANTAIATTRAWASETQLIFQSFATSPTEQILEAFVQSVCAITGCQPRQMV